MKAYYYRGFTIFWDGRWWLFNTTRFKTKRDAERAINCYIVNSPSK